MKSCVISLAAPVEKRIHRLHQLPERTNRVCNFQTMPVESQKSAEDHHKRNKENINDCRGFIVLQTQLAFFLGSGSQKFILDSFKIKRNRSLQDGSSIFKKLVRSRWLDIGFVVRDRSKKLCNGISPNISTSIVVALKRPLIQTLIIL